MTTTPGAGRRLSVRPMPPTVDNVSPEDEVPDEMREPDEEDPPDPPRPVRPPLAQLDHGEIERERQREELNHLPHREEERKQHDCIVRFLAMSVMRHARRGRRPLRRAESRT